MFPQKKCFLTLHPLFVHSILGVAEVDNCSSDDVILVMVGVGVCLAAISNGQLRIMALVMVTNLVWHDPTNGAARWAGVSVVSNDGIS